MKDIIRSIRTDLRLSMNGVIATSMREKGMDYRMNFGVDIPKLKIIAQKYSPDAELAIALWNEDVRELKILATLLYPVDNLSLEKATLWCREIPNQEIREQICMNLFQKSVLADELVKQWISDEDENIRATGYWLYARLAIANLATKNNVNTNQLVEKALHDLSSSSYSVRLAAQNALKFVGRSSKELAANILLALQDFQHAENAADVEVYNSLRFEFMTHHDKLD